MKHSTKFLPAIIIIGCFLLLSFNQLTPSFLSTISSIILPISCHKNAAPPVFASQNAAAQSTQDLEENENEIISAEVLEVIEEGTEIVNNFEAEYQLLKISLNTDQIQESIILKHGGMPAANFQNYEAGDKVFINFYQPLTQLKTEKLIDASQAIITTYDRHQAVVIIFIIFVILVLAVNRLKGVRSLLALGLSFLVIFKVALPLLLQGVEPLLVTLSLITFIIPVSFYLTHGFKKKTHVAVLGTVLALFFSILLAVSFINTARITGTTSEEASFLSIERQDQINLSSLFLAGIIIGLLGTLDDVTITQAGIVFSLKKNKPNLNYKELFLEAFAIGQDHINSMVNTLMLVYTGASLPLLLLFVNNPHPWSYVLSQEIIVEELIRMMVSSSGLIFAAPVTTFLAVLLANKEKLQAKIKA